LHVPACDDPIPVVPAALNRVLLAFNLAGLGSVLAAVLASRGRFAEAFADYGVELGALPRAVLEGPTAAWLAAGAVCGGLLLVGQWRSRRPLAMLQVHVAAVLLVVLAWSGYVGMLLVPMLRLLDSLTRT
jgi:hypothetical protein